ncbi:MAG TPA: hypothetical protein VGM03_19595, partial [Phycisphaerae bacterium]
IAVAACITLLVGIAAPSVSGIRERARQEACRSNLASVYGGLQRYASANDGALPSVGVKPGEFWLNSPDANGHVQANSRHQFLLITLHYLTNPNVLQCPSDRRAQPWVNVDWRKLEGFPTAPSYDSQNMAGPTLPLTSDGKVALMADSNPLFMDGKFHEGIDPRAANSRTHHGKGQNVLQSDGAAGWSCEPNIGRDNIWQSGDLIRYRGNEVQTSPTDSFLVP